LPVDFVSQLQSNRRTFPCGVDIVLIAGSEIAALPRSTRVSEVG
jgi:alpha-D-ribose 1-methylphosphonate 5-triphosphate synthase subunit PhnH